MELSKLKNRLAVATRGHKLLEDKQDELVRKFVDLVRRNKELRANLNRYFFIVETLLESALTYPVVNIKSGICISQIKLKIGVEVPPSTYFAIQ